MMFLRWWPPLLHLTVLAVILPLTVWHIAGIAEPDTGLRSAEGYARPASGPATDDPAADADRTADPAIDLGPLAARPLFAKDRKGDTTETAAEADNRAEASAEMDLRMVGYINDGTRITAVVAFGDSGREEVVSEGGAIAQMTVQKIGRDSLILATGDGEITIRMFDR